MGITQRSKDDIKNAFIQAHKDTHSALAGAVAKQHDSEQKLKAASESLEKATAESEDARSRARHTKETAGAAIERHTAKSTSDDKEHQNYVKKIHEVKTELTYLKKELAEQQSKAKAAEGEKTDVLAK